MDKIQDDKIKLKEMSDRELMTETLIALAGYGRRLDRIEEKLQGVYNYKAYTEGLAKQIKSISDLAIGLTENISGSLETVVGFKQLVNIARMDVDKLNTSIHDVENVKERIYSLVENVNNSVDELSTLNEKMTVIETKIQGIYEYKKYLDEIVELVNKVKTLSDILGTSIANNDNRIKSFNQTVQTAYNSVDRLNDSLSDVESLKIKIASVVDNINKSIYEINYLNIKITEIVTITNQVLQKYGDAPMVKLTNIESEMKNTSETARRTAGIVGMLIKDIHETIGEGISDMLNDVNTVKEIVEKALIDEWDAEWKPSESVYYKINDAIDQVKSAVGNVDDNISDSISSLDRKVEEMKSMVDHVKYDVYDIKDTVRNIGNSY